MKPHHRKRTEKPSTVPILTLDPCQACSSRGKPRKRGCWERAWMRLHVRRGKHSPGRIPGTQRRAGFSRWRRGCVPGSQLAACIYTTNGAPTVSQALTHTRAHTTHECIHSVLISTRRHKVMENRRERECEGEREKKRPAICWSGTPKLLTRCLYQKHTQRCFGLRVTNWMVVFRRCNEDRYTFQEVHSWTWLDLFWSNWKGRYLGRYYSPAERKKFQRS